MERAPWAAGLLFGLSLAILVTLAGPLLLFNPWFTSALQARHGVAAALSTTTPEVDRVTGEILGDLYADGPFDAALSGDELVFTFGTGNQPQSEFRGKVVGDTLTGTLKRGDRTVTLSGAHPRPWPPSNANGNHTYGTPVVLFDGKSLDAFGVQQKDRPMNWSVEEGVMTNGEKAANLGSKEKFKDFKLNAEYKVGQGTNSGIYLRGRYELQVLDDFGKPPFDRGHMAIYGWKAPSVNASKPPGEWQTMEAIVVGNRVTVTHNGQRVHDNAVLDAITGGALDNDELSPGPLMIQGDHTKVWFRKILVTPITKAGQ